MLDFLIGWLFRKATEPTTWIGIIVAVAGSLGITLTPELQSSIATAAVSIVSLALVLYTERKNRKPKDTSSAPRSLDPPPAADAGATPAGSVPAIGSDATEVPSVSGRDLHSDARPHLPPGVAGPVRPGFPPRKS
jgi:hypothetical protein